MAKITICDICGKQASYKDKYIVVTRSFGRLNTVKDFCPECFLIIRNACMDAAKKIKERKDDEENSCW